MKFRLFALFLFATAVAMAGPQQATTHYKRGTLLLEQGKFDGTVAEYHQALRLKPGYAEAHCVLGFGLFDKGQSDQPSAEFRKALRLKAHYPEAHYGLGRLLAKKGEGDAAMAEFREAIRPNPQYVEAPLYSELCQFLSQSFFHRLSQPLPAWIGGVATQNDRDGAIATHQMVLCLRPDHAQAHIGVGSALGWKNDLDGGIREYQAALRLKSNDEAVHYNLGLLLERKGDLDAAIAGYEQANSQQEHFRLGAALLRKDGRLNDAIEELREAVRMNPGDEKAASLLDGALIRRDRPWAFLETADLDTTIGGFRDAVRKQPEDAEAHYQLGRALRQRSEKGADDSGLNLDLGIVAFGSRSKISPEQIQDLQDSITELRQAVRLKPDHAEAHFALGWALHLKSHNDCEGTGIEYRAALRLNPALVYTHAHLGWLLDLCDDPESAIAEYQEFLKAIPDDDKVHYALGWALVQRGYPYWNAAAAEYTEALRLRPDHVDAEFAREAMFVLRNVGPPFLDQYEAKGNLAAYWKMDPRNADARYGAGWAHARKLELDAAYDDFLAAVSLKPDFAEAHCSGGYVLYLLARRSIHAGATNLANAEAAADAYRLALQLRPDFAEAHHGLGMALLEQAKQHRDATKERTVGDQKGIELADRAIAEFRQALLLRPQFGQARFGLGWALDFKNDLRGAQAEYQEAIRLMPNFAYAHVRLGRLLEAKGDARGAEAEFRQALRVQPDFPRDLLRSEAED